VSAPYRYHVKVLMDKLSSATYIDLARVDTQRGIGLLALAGIITSARANEILKTKPSNIEIYRG
jgi:hypothetical protein